MSKIDPFLNPTHQGVIACQYCGVNCGVSHNLKSNYCCQACEILDKGLTTLNEWDLKSNQKNIYSDYDSDYFYQKYQSQSTPHQFSFLVEGLQCSSCVHLIEKIPEYDSGVNEVRVNFGTGVMTVILNDKGKLSRLMKLIEDLGYKAQLFEEDSGVFQSSLKDDRTDLKRIAVAGVIAAQLMSFAFGIYGGMDGMLLDFFKWISFILFLPIMFYSAVPFYKGALSAIKYRVAHIDLPIVMALWAGFIFSTVNLLRGREEFYFDSTASFVFLILSTRYFVKKIQKKYLAPMNLKSLIKDDFFTLQNGTCITAEQIKVGDVFILKSGQVLPVDVTLLSDRALMNLSMISGESFPKSFSQNMELLAGYRLEMGEIEVKASSHFYNSGLQKYFNKTIETVLGRNLFLNQSDRWAKMLIMGVISLCIISFPVLFYFYGFQESFNRILALLIVACPCALAFGSPLTLSLAYRTAQKKGISIADANVFEKLDQVRSVFFDKTGTLTYGQLELNLSDSSQVDDSMKSIILTLEQVSYHPIAFAFRRAWAETSLDQTMTSVTETVGIGVSGYQGQNYFELKASQDLKDEAIQIGLFKNQEQIASFAFTDRLRPESADVIQKIKNLGLKLFILSGDKKAQVLKVAHEYNIPTTQVYYETSPDQKAQIIQAEPFSLMIGDGVNDAGALSKSFVGISLQGSHLFTVQSATLRFLNGGLTSLIDLFEIKSKSIQTLRRNLGIAIFYNLVSGVFALCGYINPFVAAILMPISTVVILLSTLWGVRE